MTDESSSFDVTDFLVEGTICAVAADAASSDTVWFIRISNDSVAEQNVCDDYSHHIKAGQHYVEGHYLERESTSIKGQTFNLMKLKVYFYKESVVYPFVQHEQKRGKLFISNNDLVEIIYYIESNGLSSI